MQRIPLKYSGGSRKTVAASRKESWGIMRGLNFQYTFNPFGIVDVSSIQKVDLKSFYKKLK